MQSPMADIDVDEGLVRRLLRSQHPDLADLGLHHVETGWDNTLWRLGEELLVRLPRRRVAAPLIISEQTWLPLLAPLLPLAIPVPVRNGRPGEEYPWPWSIVRWIDGIPGDRTTIIDSSATARRLGLFLRALHHPAPSTAPQNPYRGGPLAGRTPTFEERLAECSAEIDKPALRRVWDHATASPSWAGPPVWLHGDLHPANTLIAGGTLEAVIDFGDLCSGDPATDLAGAWMLLPSGVMNTFMAAYSGTRSQIDVDLQSRARGWAVLFGLMLSAIGLEGRATYLKVGRATLARVIET